MGIPTTSVMIHPIGTRHAPPVSPMGTSIWLSSTMVGRIILFNKPLSLSLGTDGGGWDMTISVPLTGKNHMGVGHGSMAQTMATPTGTGVSPTMLGGTKTADTCMRIPVDGMI